MAFRLTPHERDFYPLFTRAAENIAMNGGGAEATVRGWINSPGHRANIENCALTHTGVGVAGDYWTQVFFTAAGG